MTIVIDGQSALLIIALNAAAIIFACGILYNKVDGQCVRLKRVEGLLDAVLEEAITNQRLIKKGRG